jgi:hypothetical protein
MRVAILLVPFVCALAASALCLWQGGFGGGHGDLDVPIYYLGFPAQLLTERIRIFGPLDDSVIWSTIWLPALVNLLAVWLPIATIASLLKKRWH